MTKINTTIIDLCKGKKVAIDYLKSKTYIVRDFKVTDNFVSFDDNYGNPILMNKENVVFIHQRDNHKIVVNYNQSTIGEIEDLNSNFVVLKILHVQKQEYYHNFIPVKMIRGIKVYDFEDNEEEEL